MCLKITSNQHVVSIYISETEIAISVPIPEMFGRRVFSFLKRSPTPPSSSLPSCSSKAAEEGNSKALVRKAVSFILITITGGVGLSALDDLSIYYACSSQALEKAKDHPELRETIGEPIQRGLWYNASLAVAHKRRSVSCSFPVIGPQGSGIFQFKAIRNGEDTWLSFIRPRDWSILMMEALLHVPGNEAKKQSLRINLVNSLPSPTSDACTDCKLPEPAEPASQEKK